jgi:hypothetical protein
MGSASTSTPGPPTERWQQLATTLGSQPAPYRADEEPPSRTVARPAPAARDDYRTRERRRLIVGVHPSVVAPLLAERIGRRCGTCANCVVSPTSGARRHYKCALTRPNWMRGRATDVLLRWPACERFAGRPRADAEEARR